MCVILEAWMYIVLIQMDMFLKWILNKYTSFIIANMSCNIYIILCNSILYINMSPSFM